MDDTETKQILVMGDDIEMLEIPNRVLHGALYRIQFVSFNRWRSNKHCLEGCRFDVIILMGQPCNDLMDELRMNACVKSAPIIKLYN